MACVCDVKFITIKILFVIYFVMTADLAFAGYPGPLCDAVHESSYIVEVKMDGTQGKYSEAEIKKKWAPKAEEIQKILATATVTAVYKGSLQIDQRLVDASLILPSVKSDSQFWNKLFQEKNIIMLTGPGLQGWIADFGDANTPLAPYGFQTEYPVFKDAVLQCLAK